MNVNATVVCNQSQVLNDMVSELLTIFSPNVIPVTKIYFVKTPPAIDSKLDIL